MKSRILAPLCVFLASVPFLGMQADHLKRMDEVKEWRFETPQGNVEVRLSSYAAMGKPSNTVLSFEAEGTNSKPTTHELTRLLGSALKEMPSRGYDPSKLVMISAWPQDSELQAGINHAVEQSGIWPSCIRRKYCYQAQAVADRYLASVNAYKDFDDVLRLYGLHRTKVSTDDMACGGATNSDSKSHAPVKVSCVGMVHIFVERAEK